jgi:hypothetical protein
MKYRHKPLEVTAIQYTGKNEEEVRNLFLTARALVFLSGERKLEDKYDGISLVIYAGEFSFINSFENLVRLSEEEFLTHFEPVCAENAPTQGDGWQSMETAPRDGEIFIGIIKMRGNHGYGRPFLARWVEEDKEYQCDYWTELKAHIPTHWMPLPKPPEEQ